jgi:hypothetical protein
VTDADSQTFGDTLAHLQATLLRAVLGADLLPGSSDPIRMPDLDFVVRGPEVLLSNENLSPAIPAQALPARVRVFSLEELRNEAGRRGDVAYLQFQPAELGENEARLTLQARLLLQDPNHPAMGLSGVQVRFRRTDKGWQSAGPSESLPPRV